MTGRSRSHPRHRWLLTGAAALTAALALTVSATTPALAAATSVRAGTSRPATRPRTLPAPSGNAFYTPPDPLPAGSPGDIIWYRSTPSPASGDQAWQILYLSTAVSGAPTAVSGTVIVPSSPYQGNRPLVAYAPGTQGWAAQCAPSREMAAGDFDEQFAVNNLLTEGWAVVVTDYPGLGTPGPELYNVGIPEGYAVLDALRAATRLPGAGLGPDTPMGIEGYSQGGAAADWAAQLQPSYAPELDLAGVAAGGTPANLQDVANNINGGLFFAFLAGTAIGFDAAYPSLHLLSDLSAAGKTAFAQLQTMCQIPGLAAFAGKSIQDYTVGGVNPMGDPAWTKVLDANNLGSMTPQVPLYEYHGFLDEVIPYSVEQNLHGAYCTRGVDTTLTGYVGDHVLTQLEAQSNTVGWLGVRFAGTTATSDC